MVDAQFARLEQLPIDERLRELRRLEREGLASVLVVPTLREWAARTNRYALTQLARALEERNDLSWLPRVREQLRSGDANPTELMLRHGNIDDYAFIQEELRQERKGARNSGMGYSFQLSLSLHNYMVRQETPQQSQSLYRGHGLSPR